MTEAIRRATLGTIPDRATVAPAATRAAGITVPRLPAHVAVMFGLTAGAYATFLAGVTALQAASEASTAATRAPLAGSIDALAAGHERLGAALGDAADRYSTTADTYDALTVRIAAYEQRLVALSGAVANVEKAAGSLPSGISIPKSSGTLTKPARPTTPAPKPPTQGSTGASGK